jgi:hypothetical protein
MTANKLTLIYNPWAKLWCLLGLALAVSLIRLGLICHFFIAEVVLVLLGAYLFWDMFDTLNTRSITCFPDQIVKTRYFSQISIPTNTLIVKDHPREWISQFFHGSKMNIRESVKIKYWCLPVEFKLFLQSYLRNHYKIGSFSQHQAANNKTIACVQFEEAASTFQLMTVLTVIYLVCYVIYASYLAWEYQEFNGYAGDLPHWPLRLLFWGVALAAYGLLVWLAHPPEPGDYSTKVRNAQQRALYSVLTASAVAWLGFPLFLLFGDKLDFYVFLLLGICYFYGFFPRLSDWELIVQTTIPKSLNPPQRRSLHVSLALAGGLSVLGFANNSTNFRVGHPDCRDSNGTACNSGSGAIHSYFGGNGSGAGYGGYDADKPAIRSTVNRGGFGSFGRFLGSFGG